MEKIKVNMNPNPLDVQTIHASQNDGEARQWEFELHNNGELIDTSDVKEQLVFKAYKGGTEQLLPENGSTPTTSPFKGDIRYPQGLLADQEFTYRQSPTEEDGLAFVESIKGNTLVWNQLVPSLSAMRGQKGSISVANNVATITGSSSTNYLGIAVSGNLVELPKDRHKYLLTVEVNSSKDSSSCNMAYGSSIDLTEYNIPANTWTKISGILSRTNPAGQFVQIRVFGTFEQGDTIQVRNWNYFDLTQMGLDSITTIQEFTSLFPLSYYSYNQGSLLSFNGNGIKTVGKNMIDAVEQGAYSPTGEDATNTTRLRAKFVSVLPNTTYSVKISGTVTFDIIYTEFNKNDRQTQSIYQSSWVQSQVTFTTLPDCYYVKLLFKDHNNASATLTPNMATEVQMEKGSAPTNYEPYTSSTLSLPISTYFPTGMKSAGSVYDELTETKAITRIGSLKGSDIQGTVSSAVSAGGFHYVEVNGLGSKANGQGISNMLPIKNEDAWSSTVPCVQIRPTTEGSIRIYGSFTTFQEFQSQYANLVIYYELATPTETPITTASLVTENAEIPLSNEDGVLIGKCTEQLSENPGFIDAKIKLSDSDGDVYSNKIQLHIERSPQ